MTDFVTGLVEDFHRFAANDAVKAQAAYSELKKIFGFDDDTAMAYIAKNAPKEETKVEEAVKAAVVEAVPVVEQAATDAK